jgi:hypothetical protein
MAVVMQHSFVVVIVSFGFQFLTSGQSPSLIGRKACSPGEVVTTL